MIMREKERGKKRKRRKEVSLSPRAASGCIIDPDSAMGFPATEFCKQLITFPS